MAANSMRCTPKRKQKPAPARQTQRRSRRPPAISTRSSERRAARSAQSLAEREFRLPAPCAHAAIAGRSRSSPRSRPAALEIRTQFHHRAEPGAVKRHASPNLPGQRQIRLRDAIIRAELSSWFAAVGRRRSRLSLRLSKLRKRSEGESNTDGRSNVRRVEIRDAGAVRNGNGQTTGHDGIGNSYVTVQTLGEVMIRVERHLVEGARAGTSEISGRAGLRNTEVVLPLLIPGHSDVGFRAVSVFRARPPDLQQLLGIKIVVFDPAHDVAALVRRADA